MYICTYNVYIEEFKFNYASILFQDLTEQFVSFVFGTSHITFFQEMDYKMTLQEEVVVDAMGVDVTICI